MADRNRPLEPVTAPEPDTLPSEHDRTRRSLLSKLLAPLVVLIGVVVKFGAFVLKFFGIFLAVGGYALIWGWKFGVGVVLLILAHELGHYIEAKRLGLDPQLPVFIPFLGAYVALRNMRFDPWVNARVSLAGPVVGQDQEDEADAELPAPDERVAAHREEDAEELEPERAELDQDPDEHHQRREQPREQRAPGAVVLARQRVGLGRGDRLERAVAVGHVTRG